MASKITLHIGLQKSGTTYLQSVLGRCAGELAEIGVLYPTGNKTIETHERILYGLLGTEFPWVTEERARSYRSQGKWLVSEVARWPGRVLLSAEALSVIRTPAIHSLLDSLGCADVDIIVTARDLGRALPSLWQQHILNGFSTSMEGYLQGLASERARPHEEIENERALHRWRAFALGGLLRRWSAVTGAARVRLVTNPGSPPELLWHRFGQVAEIGEFAGRVPEQVLRRRVHTGLTAPEVAVLARVNAAVSETGQGRQEAYRLRDDIVTRGFAARTDRGPNIALPVTSREQVAEWSRSDLADVSDAGVQIVGDLAELRYEPDRDEAHQDASPTEVAEAAAAAVMALAAAPQRGQGLVFRLARPQPRRTPKLRWPPSGRSS